MSLIPAFLKDDDFLRNVLNQPADPGRFQLWWLGQSGYLLQWNGRHVLIDPYLSDSLTKKYASTRKPHIRMSERVIDPARLDFIDIITSSHNHTDHLDAETILPVWKASPQATLLIPEANRAFVADRLNCPPTLPTGLSDGESCRLGDFVFHGIPAAHNEIERDDQGHCRFMGYVIAFGSWQIYHSGDTLWFPGMEEILQKFSIDLALLPINGNDPAREVAGNLNTREAALLAKAIGARRVIPCHYDMFSFNTADPNLFEKEAQSIDQPYTVLQPGERFDSGQL